MQGLDLVGGLERRSDKDRMAFSEEDHEGNVLRSIRSAEWKLIEANADNPRGLPANELFFVAEDIGEERDVYGAEAGRVAELRRHADAHEQIAKSQATESDEPAELTPADKEALRALGYMD